MERCAENKLFLKELTLNTRGADLSFIKRKYMSSKLGKTGLFESVTNCVKKGKTLLKEQEKVKQCMGMPRYITFPSSAKVENKIFCN